MSCLASGLRSLASVARHPSADLPRGANVFRQCSCARKRLSFARIACSSEVAQDTATTVLPPAHGSGLARSNGVHTTAPAAAKTEQPPAEVPVQQDLVLFYRTGWPACNLHHSTAGSEWATRPFAKVASSDGKWSVVRVPTGEIARPGAPELSFEFVINDGSDGWDKPPTGGNYQVTAAGVYALRDGALARVTVDPIMLVSDLDDTMVGDDAATAAFRVWWETTAVPRGSALVYNTGRALHKFEQLLEEKAGCLPRPDVLISSVGTCIYTWQAGRGWVEDSAHLARLDQHWDLDIVREAAYAALATVGKERMHFRPPDEQNDHKVTCGVSTDAVDQVLQQIGRALERGGVKARLILSGTGDWRFLDIVSDGAGKLAALEYVREKLGFARSHTVASGDSGNDQDMLSGENPAIVVGNAQPDLMRWVESVQQQAAEHSGRRRRLVAARASRAAGILEGLEALGFL